VSRNNPSSVNFYFENDENQDDDDDGAPRNDENESQFPPWQKLHNRYEIASYSRKMVALDPSSYHRLGLAFTESHIDTGK
jgi:hypothetical protein